MSWAPRIESVNVVVLLLVGANPHHRRCYLHPEWLNPDR